MISLGMKLVRGARIMTSAPRLPFGNFQVPLKEADVIRTFLREQYCAVCKILVNGKLTSVGQHRTLLW